MIRGHLECAIYIYSLIYTYLLVSHPLFWKIESIICYILIFEMLPELFIHIGYVISKPLYTGSLNIVHSHKILLGKQDLEWEGGCPLRSPRSERVVKIAL